MAPRSYQTPPASVSKPSKAIGHVLALPRSGADLSMANSPPSLCCPYHLHHSYIICAAVKMLPLPAVSSYPFPSNSVRPSSPVITRRAVMISGNGSKSKKPAQVCRDSVQALMRASRSWASIAPSSPPPLRLALYYITPDGKRCRPLCLWRQAS